MLCRDTAIVMLNGTILGVHRQPVSFATALRRLRRCNRIGEFVSVYIQQECVHIASDGGRYAWLHALHFCPCLLSLFMMTESSKGARKLAGSDHVCFQTCFLVDLSFT